MQRTNTTGRASDTLHATVAVFDVCDPEDDGDTANAALAVSVPGASAQHPNAPSEGSAAASDNSVSGAQVSLVEAGSNFQIASADQPHEDSASAAHTAVSDSSLQK